MTPFGLWTSPWRTPMTLTDTAGSVYRLGNGIGSSSQTRPQEGPPQRAARGNARCVLQPAPPPPDRLAVAYFGGSHRRWHRARPDSVSEVVHEEADRVTAGTGRRLTQARTRCLWREASAVG